MRVNRLIMEHAPKMDSKKSNKAVQAQTLKTQQNAENILGSPQNQPECNNLVMQSAVTILSKLRIVSRLNLSDLLQS